MYENKHDKNSKTKGAPRHDRKMTELSTFKVAYNDHFKAKGNFELNVVKVVCQKH